MEAATPQPQIHAELERTLQAAYLPSTVSAVAGQTGLSRPQVRRAAKAAMWASLQQQHEFLENVVASGARFKICWESIEFDETRQRLQVAAHKDLLKCQQTSAWNVCVCCHEFGYIGHDDSVNILDVLRLNKILVGSANSGCIWDALVGGREIQETKRLIDVIRSRSEDTFLVYEPDAASPNLKLGPHQLNELRTSSQAYDRQTLFDMLVCGLHQANHIIQMIFSSSSSLALIRGLHSLALLVGTGNYFMRMVFVIVQVLRGCLVVSHEPPGIVLFCNVCVCVCIQCM